MKLVDILARELVEWPETTILAQDDSGHVFGWSSSPEWLDEQWVYSGCSKIDECRPGVFDLAEDRSTALVTRAEWQAAVEALKAAEFPQESDWPDGSEYVGYLKEGGIKHFYRNVVEGSFELWISGESAWATMPGEPSYKPLTPLAPWRATGKAEPQSPAAEWKEGDLPPVGITCECKQPGEWSPVKILAHLTDDPRFDPIAIYMAENDPSAIVRQAVAYCFRPILTPQQKADKDREEAIKQICIDAGRPAMTEKNKAQAAKLYDAGYRKVSPSQEEE